MSIKHEIKQKTNALIKRTNWYQNERFLGCKKFWTLSTFDLDVINLGSSAAFYGFDYKGINSLKCMNMAMTSQYLLADYEILRNYFSYLKPGATVMLGTCLFSLDGYDVTYFGDRYYTFLYPSSIWHFSMQRQKEVKAVQTNPLNYYPLMSIPRDLKYFIKGDKEKCIPTSAFEKNAEHWMYDCWGKEFSIEDFDAPLSLRNTDLRNQAIEIVGKIRDFCADKGFRFVMVLPPVSPALRKLMSPKMREQYVETFMRSEKLKDVEFRSYIDDSDFDDTSNFKNAYFLNRQGARKFTKKVLYDLNLIQ